MTQADDILARLRDEILSLALPPGFKLTERGLENRFAGPSRTPLRAALLRLEGEGLVRRAGKGWLVAPLDIAAIEALSEYREGLEAAAIRLAIQRASPADWDALASLVEAAARPPDRAALHRAGTEFHTALARLCGNEFIARAVEDVMARLARARWIEIWLGEQAAERVPAEHRAIVAAARARDTEQAVSLATTHVREMRDRLVHALTDAASRLHVPSGFAIIGKAAAR